MSNPLMQVPGLAGYLARRQMLQGEESGELQQAQAATGLMAALEKRKQDAQLREVLAASGGDVEKAIEAAVKSGNIGAARELAPLAKMAQERRMQDETQRGLGALLTSQQPAQPANPMGPGGASVMAPQGATPAPAAASGTQARIEHLNKLALLYPNNAVVQQRIQAEIDKLQAAADKPPMKRERIEGETLIQEEIGPGGVAREIGRGPRFARQVAPVTPPNVAGEQSTKPPTGYRWKGGVVNGELEPIPGGPATRTPPERALPTAAAQKLFENQQNLRRAETALALMEGRDVGAMQGDPNATGWKGFMPDMWLQRMDPKGTDARAALADLGSLVIHERSGAAVTAAEFPRLQPFIPKINDDPETVKKKLKRFAQIYRDVASETANFYKESGYKVPDLIQGTQPATPAPAAAAAGPSVESLLEKYK